MPVNPGSSRNTIAANIKELHSGKQYAKTKAKHGAKTANRQAVAIAISEAGKSGRRSRTIAEG